MAMAMAAMVTVTMRMTSIKMYYSKITNIELGQK